MVPQRSSTLRTTPKPHKRPNPNHFALALTLRMSPSEAEAPLGSGGVPSKLCKDISCSITDGSLVTTKFPASARANVHGTVACQGRPYSISSSHFCIIIAEQSSPSTYTLQNDTERHGMGSHGITKTCQRKTDIFNRAYCCESVQLVSSPSRC